MYQYQLNICYWSTRAPESLILHDDYLPKLGIVPVIITLWLELIDLFKDQTLSVKMLLTLFEWCGYCKGEKMFYFNVKPLLV